MSIKSTLYYWVECDKCGTTSTDEYSAYDSADFALEIADSYEWLIDEDNGTQHCDVCREEMEK